MTPDGQLTCWREPPAPCPWQGKAILRVTLNQLLIRKLKTAAIDAGVTPGVIVEAALSQYLEEKL